MREARKFTKHINSLTRRASARPAPVGRAEAVSTGHSPALHPLPRVHRKSRSEAIDPKRIDGRIGPPIGANRYLPLRGESVPNRVAESQKKNRAPPVGPVGARLFEA